MKILILCLTCLLSYSSFAENFIIYSISHEIPMENEFDNLKKNYYLNIGSSQGIESGTILQVFRTITRQDPYENKKRFRYKVPIGKLQVVHTENKASIAISNKLLTNNDGPLFEVSNFMVGDQVSVDTD